MELFLSHNPYKITTIFQIDGKNCKDPWFIDLSSQDGIPSRLQMWLGRFFDELHRVYFDVEKIQLRYKGTTADCHDVQDEAALASTRLGIEIMVRSDACGDPDTKFEELRGLYVEAIKGPYEDFKKLELNSDFKRIEDRLLSVSIMAIMKNGKSTLLNAILGKELLPNATQRCTAKISYIEHCKGMDGFEAKSVNVDGVSSEYLPCENIMLQEWNANNVIRNVRIRGALPGVEVGDFHLQFVDTPGPDSAVHREDQVTIERFLNDNSLPMICYIIDRVNESEEGYLKRLRTHMNRFGKQSEDRFIFVVSRMDQIDVPKDVSKEENPIRTKIEDIKADLRRLGIFNPRIFPVSAKIALKAREYHNILDEEEREDIRDDIKKFRRGMRRIDSTLLDYTSVSLSIKNQIAREIEQIKKKIEEDLDSEADNLRLAELLSGIPALEMAVEEYVTKYSVPARIYDAATIFSQGIQKANAIDSLVTEINSKQTSIESISENIGKLRDFLSKGVLVKQLKANMFPEKWIESPTLKRELSCSEREFDLKIREELANWNPQTRDKDGNVTPEEAKELANGFVEFMSKLSSEMLVVYASHVEEDARDGFNKLRVVYEDKIKEILGEMPQKLLNFLNRVNFVLAKSPRMVFDTDALIVETTEKYISTFKREITIEKDGFWQAAWSLMPFTDMEKETSEGGFRKVKRVPYQKLKSGIKKQASYIIQAGVEKAEAAAEEQYRRLRSLMMEQFDKIDVRLAEFNQELVRNLSVQEGEKEKILEYSKVLEWVRRFQEKLEHVLDLED